MRYATWICPYNIFTECLTFLSIEELIKRKVIVVTFADLNNCNSRWSADLVKLVCAAKAVLVSTEFPYPDMFSEILTTYHPYN